LAGAGPDRCLTVGQKGTVKVWDLTRPGADPVRYASTASQLPIAVTPDGRRLLLWRAPDQLAVLELGAPVQSAAALPDSGRFYTPIKASPFALQDGWLAVGGEDGVVRL